MTGTWEVAVIGNRGRVSRNRVQWGASCAPAATTPIATLERRPETRPVMEAYMPNITKNPAYPRFSSMSLKQLQARDPRLSDQMLARIDAALQAAEAPPSAATTPIFLLAANPATLAVLDTHFPGLTGHPNYGKFRYLSLKELQGFDPRITDDMLAATQSGLDGIASSAATGAARRE